MTLVIHEHRRCFIIIVRQHAMLAVERDTVMAFLSVRPSSAGTISKRMDISANFIFLFLTFW